MLGQQVGSYRVVRKLGEGGMGAVFEGVQEEIGRHVAIKVLLASAAGDPQIAQRFFNEARAVNLIDHPSLVEIFDMGHLPDGAAFIVMELLKGESLTDRIRSAPQGLGTQALRIARQIASALAAAHGKQIVHRDLKPDNVFVVPDPEAAGGERAKVLDFGIAKMAAELQPTPLRTSAHAVMGTPAYMAPEQCRSSTNVDDKADVYALGIILFQMLSGRLPFYSADTMQLLYAHVHEPPPPLVSVVPDVAPEIEAAVNAMLAKEPAARPTMAEVASTMTQLGGGMTSVVPVTSEPNAPTMHLLSRDSSAPVAGEVAKRTLALKEDSSAPVVGEVAKRTPVLKQSRLPLVIGLVGCVAVIGGAAATALILHGTHPARSPVAASANPMSARAVVPSAPEPCGPFVNFFVPTPPGMSLSSCFDTNGSATLTFSGYGNPSFVCAPMKRWASSLGWVPDSERASGSVESLALHRDRERLTLLCTASGGTTTVSVSLAPRS
jgi:serine/threonine protein kinase